MRPARTIVIEGSGLLPPQCEPQIPGDLAFGELVTVMPPDPPWQPNATEMPEYAQHPKFDGRYWRLAEGNQHPTDALFAWTNNPGSGQPVVGHGWGLDRVAEVAEFRFRPKLRKQGLPDFWQTGGVLIVSSRLLATMCQLAADAIVSRRVVMKDLYGTVFDEDHHLIDIVRRFPALDYANSVIEYLGPEQSDSEQFPARVNIIRSARFRTDMPADLHLFRQGSSTEPGWGRGIFVSADLKRRLEALHPKPRNLSFDPLFLGFA